MALNSSDADVAFPASDHDHGVCVDQAIAAAKALCAQRGARFTALRQRVFELVWDSHAPTGAYDVLESMRREGRRAAPPTVYRALDFLVEHGLVHRIESLNAYVGCADPGNAHTGQFLICRVCGSSVEVDDPEITAAIAARCGKAGFRMQQLTLEVTGLCPDCQTRDTAGHG